MIRVLITDLAHPVTPGTLMSLRESANGSIYIIGVDTDPQAVGFHYTDNHHLVPSPSKNPAEYIQVLLDICIKEDVDLIIPWSDTEVEIIAQHSETFKSNGIKFMCSSLAAITRTVDKGTLLQEMQQAGIPTPDYFLASSPAEIEDAAIRLGYPEKPVIVKPRKSHGSKGLWRLDREINLFQKSPFQQIPLPSLVELLNNADTLPDYIVMPYLAGHDYSVDVLAEGGAPICAIPRIRIRTFGGASFVGEFDFNPEVETLAKRIVSHFELDFIVNVQIKYSNGPSSMPFIYEINPRMPGTVIVNRSVGADLLYWAILLALGKPLPDPLPVNKTNRRFARYWKEYYF